MGNDPVNYVDPAGTTRRRPLTAREARQNTKIAQVVSEQIAKALPDGKVKDFVQRSANGLRAINNSADRRTQLETNKANGKAAENAVATEMGDKVAGQQVTFKTSDGTVTRTDIVTTDKGVVEVKSGNAQLSTGQQKLSDDINAGREVTPVGQNAANAGLEPGKPTTMTSCTLERKC